MRTVLHGSQISCGDTRISFNARIRVGGAELSAPDAWISTDDPAKDPREVRLIMHAAVEGDL